MPSRKKRSRRLPSTSRIAMFAGVLERWYQQNGRNLPWRENLSNEYVLVVSEVLLQRTRAETIAAYLAGFLESYPGWEDLASASEGDLQKALKPIGLWKRRAASLLGLAHAIVEHGGNFPAGREQIERIPAVGQYVANAIELFCHGVPRPLLDANMARCLERFFGQRELADIRYDPYLQRLAQRYVEQGSPVVLNWAILDFAAEVCVSGNPRCTQCPLASTCKHGRAIPQLQDNQSS